MVFSSKLKKWLTQCSTRTIIHRSACTSYDSEQINLAGRSKQDIKHLLQCTKHSLFSNPNVLEVRVNQLFRWIYHVGETDFYKMVDLDKQMKQILNERFKVEYCDKIVEHRIDSNDGTMKFLLQFRNNNEIAKQMSEHEQFINEKKHFPRNEGSVQVECVYIPEISRGTMCISSQVGCSLNCKFCHTGTQVLERNLKSYEIVNQIMTAKKMINDFNHNSSEKRKITNVVFMGQGEPLYAYKDVKKAIEVISDSSGLSIGHRMITVSTSGVVPIIERLNKELPNVCLAISLHATTDELRNELVPINKIYPLSVLINTIKTLPNLKSNRRLIFEYVMLQGVNDSFADADRLIELLKDLPAIVNLIPFNNWPNSGFQSSTDEHIYAFSHYLNVRGLRAPIRWSKGADILGACGQLRSTSKLKQSFIKSLAERQATKDNVINI